MFADHMGKDGNLANALVKDAEAFLTELASNSGNLKFKDSGHILAAIATLGGCLNEAVMSIQFVSNTKDADITIMEERIAAYTEAKNFVAQVAKEILKRT